MKFNRAYFILSLFASLALCVAMVVALGGYFRAVEKGGSEVGTEKRLLSQLRVFHEQLRRADGPEEAKAALKGAENLTGFGAESDLALELKKSYGPLLGLFAAKPREAEQRYQLAKKRELMETLVNMYRKEVLHGDLRVRAGYLNILFDTQTSLLNESDETEQVYLRRNRERIEGLKTLTAGFADKSVAARVAAVDGVFSGYERGFQQGTKWRAEKAEALARQEKALPAIAKGIFSGEDSGVDETRRTFLYVCFLSLLVAGVSLLSLFLGFKLLRVRAELKVDAFLAYLRAFGTERSDPQLQSSVQSLREDADWAAVLTEAQRAEESFVRSCQNQLAVPRSLLAPFLLVGKDRSIRYWNESAAALFGLSDGKEWGIEDILHAERIGAKEGNVQQTLDLVRSAFASLTEDRFDLLVRHLDGWHPYEVILSPITSGPLAGGKLYLWREVRGEAERMDRAVALQVERLRDLVHKVTHQYEADLVAKESDSPAARAMIDDLALLKGRIGERELLWKSEVQALIDQVSRQQEILHRLSEELGRVRQEQTEALDLVRSVHGGEEHLHDEVCVLERDLERWSASRSRLLRDLEQQSSVLDRARRFEEQLRTANEEMSQVLDSYENEIKELRQFAEAAKVHSVNLSLVRDPGYWEYAARARSFAQELAQFVAKAESLGERVRGFMNSHPGGALAAHLSGSGLDGSLIAAIGEEQERLGVALKRWKESGETILGGGERALALLQDAERKSAALAQLGETSLLINQQAKGNLERWN